MPWDTLLYDYNRPKGQEPDIKGHDIMAPGGGSAGVSWHSQIRNQWWPMQDWQPANTPEYYHNGFGSGGGPDALAAASTVLSLRRPPGPTCPPKRGMKEPAGRAPIGSAADFL